jgi:preprotein translocase subunit SecE
MATIERFNGFLKEVRVEVRKVTWPSKGELWESTVVVLVTVAIISLFIFVVDRVVGTIVTKIL